MSTEVRTSQRGTSARQSHAEDDDLNGEGPSTEVRTLHLRGSAGQDPEAEEASQTMSSGLVTVIAPGRSAEVPAGATVRATLTRAGIIITPDQLIRVGRDQVTNPNARTCQPGEVVTVVPQVKAGTP